MGPGKWRYASSKTMEICKGQKGNGDMQGTKGNGDMQAPKGNGDMQGR